MILASTVQKHCCVVSMMCFAVAECGVGNSIGESCTGGYALHGASSEFASIRLHGESKWIM